MGNIMLKKILFSILLTLSIMNLAPAADYPADWWKPVTNENTPGWEVLPQHAKPGEVILSKRNELGIFSNLAYSPFVLDGVAYASVEGLWQGMKYPDLTLSEDLRTAVTGWESTRAEVFQMSSWDSKSAGNAANQMYADNGFKLINYFDHWFIYTDGKEGSLFHLELITRAIRAKVTQNPEIKALLLRTAGLHLRPDHLMSENVYPSFKYHVILEKIREELLKEETL
jgi:predicted NAD-dependent protein-ADP-ribosyltransferase YbiA (DUF1768 family)